MTSPQPLLAIAVLRSALCKLRGSKGKLQRRRMPSASIILRKTKSCWGFSLGCSGSVCELGRVNRHKVRLGVELCVLEGGEGGDNVYLLTFVPFRNVW